MAALRRVRHRIPVVGGPYGRPHHRRISAASGGRRAPKDIKVRLLDGRAMTWRLRSNKDLERNLSCLTTGSSVLKEEYTNRTFTNFLDLREGQMYEVLPPSVKGFTLLVPGSTPQQRLKVSHLTEDALGDILIRLRLSGVQPVSGLGEDESEWPIYISIQDLKADTEYVGVPLSRLLP